MYFRVGAQFENVTTSVRFCWPMTHPDTAMIGGKLLDLILAAIELLKAFEDKLNEYRGTSQRSAVPGKGN